MENLEKIIDNYKNNPDVDTLKTVFDSFELLATRVFNYFITKTKNIGKEIFRKKKATIRELVCLAFLKMSRYDPTKGRAVNFFTTTMLGWLRQVYRSKKNYAELKVKYAEKTQDFKTGK